MAPHDPNDEPLEESAPPSGERTPSSGERDDAAPSGSEREPDRGKEPDLGKIENLRARTSVGAMSDEHWSVARKELNQEALDYYRSRDEAPGVADCDSPRNSYCFECDGVIPLAYDSSKPPDPNEKVTCPHCGAEQPQRVRRMYNWVEIDQVHGSDLRALLPLFVAGAVALALVLFWIL